MEGLFDGVDVVFRVVVVTDVVFAVVDVDSRVALLLLMTILSIS